MTAAAQTTDRPSRAFAGGLLAGVLTLLIVGIGGFWYLTLNSPLSLLSGGDRPIAVATAFVPARSPFTLSLLTRPERLVALQQAIASPDQRRQTHREISQIKQSLLENTGLDYDRDIRPWVGNEITFALTDQDLEFDSAGQQPGYLLALEIAPGQQQQARNFLQTLWQEQSLTAGHPPHSQQVSGVRILYAPDSQQFSQGSAPSRPQLKGRLPTLTAASALVGNQFVIFANDVRVLRRSIRAAQTAANLAQNPAYRQAVAQLPNQRIGLAYFNAAALGNLGDKLDLAGASLRKDTDKAAFTAVSLGVTRTGLVAHAQLSDPLLELPANDSARSRAEAALQYLPADSAIALTSQDLRQLAPTLKAIGLPEDILPNFLFLEQPPATQTGSVENGGVASAPQPDPRPNSLSPELWNWATADYSLGQVNASQSPGWILAVARNAEGIADLDRAIAAQGYSAVPVGIGENEAIAWTRFRVSPQRRVAANSLETEILGLHLQQGDYEIFASSPAAMDAALAAPQNSLLEAEQFTQAIAPLPAASGGYLYIDWPAIAPTAERTFPILSLVDVAARPFVNHIQTLAAAREDETASLFIQLSPAGKTAPSQADE